jgi:hypothetical protein
MGAVIVNVRQRKSWFFVKTSESYTTKVTILYIEMVNL